MMSLGRRRAWIRASLLLRQNGAVAAIIAAWFLGNLVIFWAALGRGPKEALLTTFFFKVDPSYWGSFYQAFSDFVIFGLTVSVIVTDLYRRYRPEETCRLLAGDAAGHVIVIGYTNLGQRVVELARSAGRPVVLIEERRALVEALIREEHPLVLGAGRDAGELAAANVRAASMVVVASDDMETVAVAAKLVREVNKSCGLLLRCADDDVGEILAKAYKARVISTSKMAAGFVAAYAEKHAVRSCIIVGCNNVGRRLLQVMKDRRTTKYMVIEADRGALQGLAGDEPITVGPPSSVEVLTKAGVGSAELVVLTDNDLGQNLVLVDRIRGLNTWCRIVCRIFQEDAAEVLTQKPFTCEVISTSKHAVETLVREGAFRPAKIERAMRPPK